MKISRSKTIQDIQGKITQFDSCTAILNALSLYLKDEDFVNVGITPRPPSWFGKIINAIPENLRSSLYRWSGWLEALEPDQIKGIKTESIAQWVISKYPTGQYPAILFGSSNGAVAHIGAALGAPWFPQTFLLAIRRNLPPDEIKKDIEWGKEVIKPLLKANPGLAAHQMHDPLQDRLMVQKMGYFRLKLLDWEEPFVNFTKKYAPKAPLISIECQYAWPVYKVQDRHYFQLGGFGGLTGEEYLKGGPRVQKFLKDVKAPVRKWDTYKPTGKLPEAEWGFREEMFLSARKFARKLKIPIYRLIFDHPEGLTHFTAELYRWWYKKRGITTTTLLIENFGLLEPRRTILSHALPLWLAFNTQCSAELAEKYLRKHHFDQIFLMLMSNGVKKGMGLVDINRWKNILKKAKQKGDFIGVEEALYPLDFGTFLKYHKDLKKKMPHFPDTPQRLTLNELEEFIHHSKGRYPLRWIKG